VNELSLKHVVVDAEKARPFSTIKCCISYRCLINRFGAVFTFLFQTAQYFALYNLVNIRL